MGAKDGDVACAFLCTRYNFFPDVALCTAPVSQLDHESITTRPCGCCLLRLFRFRTDPLCTQNTRPSSSTSSFALRHNSINHVRSSPPPMESSREPHHRQQGFAGKEREICSTKLSSIFSENNSHTTSSLCLFSSLSISSLFSSPINPPSPLSLNLSIIGRKSLSSSDSNNNNNFAADIESNSKVPCALCANPLLPTERRTRRKCVEGRRREIEIEERTYEQNCDDDNNDGDDDGKWISIGGGGAPPPHI